MNALRTRGLALVGAVAAALTLAACSASAPAATSSASPSAPAASADAAWPRTITHEAGEVTLERKPERIVSTTPSVTGTLLAMNAPVVSSAASTPNVPTSDENGFFAQWADVAVERGVGVLYSSLEFDLEAIIAAKPDLVVISTSGADSVLDHYESISALFPTIVVNYSNKSWQELAVELGAATGLEAEAAAAVADFDAYVAAGKERITKDPGTVSIVSFNGAEDDSAIAKSTSPWAALMTGLGIEVVGAPDELDTSEQVRQDVAWVSFENLTAGILGDTVYLLSASEDLIPVFTSEATLANLTAVKNGQVHALGNTSFRIDNYSGRAFVDTVVKTLS